MDELFKDIGDSIESFLKEFVEKMPDDVKQSSRNLVKMIDKNTKDDLNYLDSAIKQLKEDYSSGNMFGTLESVTDLATVRNVFQMFMDKYY